MKTIQKASLHTDNEIDNSTLLLLKTVFGNTETMPLPVDLNQIMAHCGLTIRQGEFTTDPSTEGILSRREKTVFLSETDTPERKNFTLAHEIGHYKLHEDVDADIFKMHELDDLLTRKGQDTKEDEADMFAASLLMPKDLIKSFWKTTKDIGILARIFGVPEIAVEFRLRNLGLL